VLFVQALALVDQLRAIEQQQPPENPEQTDARTLRMKAVAQQIEEKLKMLYLHQEPWLLNARLARRVAVAL
jgi:hypothetical protein